LKEEARQWQLAVLKRGGAVPIPTNLMEREKLENNAESAHIATVNDNQLSVSEKLALALFDAGENEFSATFA